MSRRLEGKVAFITGAARGQGRAEAARFAEEGASLILVDLPAPIQDLIYELPTRVDLDETVALCEKAGARVYVAEADVRDLAALERVAHEGAAEFGGIDVVVANAGIFTLGRLVAEDKNYSHFGVLSSGQWQDMIDICLTGVYNTVRAAVPSMIEKGSGGVVLLTSSGLGLVGAANTGHYTAAKHGVVGLMRSLANELGEHRIRVNSIHPGCVNTDMIQNTPNYRLYRPDLEHPTADDFRATSSQMTTLPVPYVEPIDVANAMVFLASDEARYITGVTLPVDAGTLV